MATSSNENEVNIVFCECNGVCKQKKGKRTSGCPCKNAGVTCKERCACGRKKNSVIVNPCVNGKPILQEVDGESQIPVNETSDGWNRMEKELKKSSDEIKDFLHTLSRDELESIILKTAALGDGSIDFVKDTLEAASLEESSVRQHNQPDWCKCGHCSVMPTLKENKCCSFKKCVTTYKLFEKYCLDKDILVINIKARCDIRAEEWNFSSNDLRKAGYRQFILWKYGKLGKSNRRVIPSCVVMQVRNKFPSRDGTYMGYYDS